MLLSEEEWIQIAEPAAGAPKWREDAIAPDQLELLRRRFDAGDRLAFRIHVPVRRKRSRAASSYFAVLLEKDEQLKRGEHHFIRRGITIPRCAARATSRAGHSRLADTTRSPRSSRRGKPAHSDWSERNDKIRNTYENGAYTLRYVKNAVSQLAALVTTPPAGRAPDLLAEISRSPSLRRRSVWSAAAAATAFRRGSRSCRSPNIPLKTPEHRIKILPVAGGFALRGSGSLTDVGVAFLAEWPTDAQRQSVPQVQRLRFHDRRRWFVAQLRRSEHRAAAGNRLEFLPTRPDFHLALTGFDARRDLMVRLSRKDDDAAEAELH